LSKIFKGLSCNTKDKRIKILSSILATKNLMTFFITLCIGASIVYTWILYPNTLPSEAAIYVNFFIMLMLFFERILMVYLVEIKNGWM
jgi:hypothetical protein